MPSRAIQRGWLWIMHQLQCGDLLPVKRSELHGMRPGHLRQQQRVRRCLLALPGWLRCALRRCDLLHPLPCRDVHVDDLVCELRGGAILVSSRSHRRRELLFPVSAGTVLCYYQWGHQLYAL